MSTSCMAPATLRTARCRDVDVHQYKGDCDRPGVFRSVPRDMADTPRPLPLRHARPRGFAAAGVSKGNRLAMKPGSTATRSISVASTGRPASSSWPRHDAGHGCRAGDLSPRKRTGPGDRAGRDPFTGLELRRCGFHRTGACGAPHRFGGTQRQAGLHEQHTQHRASPE